MAYDATAESLRLIESRELTPVTSLSRRRRHAPMAVDVAGDIAVTMFARRSVGCIVEEVHVLSLQGGEWVMLGGGSGPADDDALAPRPAELPVERSASAGVDPRIATTGSSGGILDSRRARSLWPTRGRWINHGTVRVNAAVDQLVVHDRQIAVPWHGRCVVAWPGRRPQDVDLLAENGTRLGQVTLLPSP